MKFFRWYKIDFTTHHINACVILRADRYAKLAARKKQMLQRLLDREGWQYDEFGAGDVK